MNIKYLCFIVLLTGCSLNEFPAIEGKAAKICIDAGLVPDTHMKPYRCVITDDDQRLK